MEGEGLGDVQRGEDIQDLLLRLNRAEEQTREKVRASALLLLSSSSFSWE